VSAEKSIKNMLTFLTQDELKEFSRLNLMINNKKKLLESKGIINTDIEKINVELTHLNEKIHELLSKAKKRSLPAT
jgi:hypothetical protein